MSLLERLAEGPIRKSITRKLLPLVAGTSFLAVYMTETLGYYLTARLLDPEKVRVYRHLAAAANLVSLILCGLLLTVLILTFYVIVRFYAEPLARTSAWAAACIRDGILHPYEERTPVTEVNEMAGHVGLLTGELHERVRELQDLPRDIRHCLIAYLTHISNTAQRLEAGRIARDEAVESIISTTETMRDILNLEVTITENYSRISGGRPEPVDVSEILEGCIRRLTGRMEERRIALSVKSPANPIVRMAHRQKLASLVHNLLDNAIKYNRNGGTVSVGLGADARGIVLTVADSGIGIPAEEQPDIFRRGRRGAAVRNGPIEGTGHGLALVHSIVKYYLGEISCKSKPGEGTTFTVSLPIKKGTDK